MPVTTVNETSSSESRLLVVRKWPAKLSQLEGERSHPAGDLARPAVVVERVVIVLHPVAGNVPVGLDDHDVEAIG